MIHDPHVPATHLDLTRGRVGVLSTIGSSGRPQSTAVWFMVDEDGVVRTSLTNDRQKTKNMVANPKATLFVIDPANPYRTLELRCDVAISDDPDLTMMRRIVAHYGADFESFPGSREGRVLVELTPRRIIAQG
jgi:PPOX class probable F420-dependent enzyme